MVVDQFRWWVGQFLVVEEFVTSLCSLFGDLNAVAEGRPLLGWDLLNLGLQNCSLPWHAVLWQSLPCRF